MQGQKKCMPMTEHLHERYLKKIIFDSIKFPFKASAKNW